MRHHLPSAIHRPSLVVLGKRYYEVNMPAPPSLPAFGSCPTLGHPPWVQSLHHAVYTLSLQNWELRKSLAYKVSLICGSLMIKGSDTMDEIFA